MAKRANGEGNIRKRQDGKWLVTFPTGLYKENGKREYIYRYCSTQAEAKEALVKLQMEKGLGINQMAGKVKTGDWVEHWIEDLKATKLAPATLTSYRNNFRLHIRPVIGEIPLQKLETYHVQRMLNNIKGASCSTFVKNYNIIHGALEKAVELGMIVRNPCKGVAFPADDRHEMRVLTPEEQQAFVKALEGEYYRPLFLLYLYSGLRLGEGLALRWTDIDLKNKRIRVNKKVIVFHDFSQHSAKVRVENKCKTKSSNRTVVITPGLVSVLAEHKAAMMEQARQEGEIWTDDRLAFVNIRGNMIYARNLQHVLERICKKAGIKGATMHTLRHSYATRCFEAGVDIKAISEQLGHLNVKTTYNIYVHLLQDTKVKEIEKLGEIDKLLA